MAPRLIGVIDVRDDLVVHAVAGNRREYQSLLGGDGLPLTVATRARDLSEMGLRELYLADIDAITGRRDVDFAMLQAVREQVECLWYDIGLSEPELAEKAREWMDQSDKTTVAIVGLETLRTASHLPAIANTLGVKSMAFSIDMRKGIPTTICPEWAHLQPLEISCRVRDRIPDLNRWILLDLAAVGTRSGCPTLGLCSELRSKMPDAELVTGGGVRDHADVAAIGAAGGDGVLIGSAIESLV